MDKNTPQRQDIICEIIWDLGKKLDVEHLKIILSMIQSHLEIKTKG
jgi:hypothetical protein